MSSSPNTMTFDVTLDSTLADTPAIALMRGGNVLIPTGSSITSLTYYSGDGRQGDGNYLPAYDQDGVAITQTVAAGRSYQIPESLFGCEWIKILTNADGAAVISMKG